MLQKERDKFKTKRIDFYVPWEWGLLFNILTQANLTPRQILKATISYLRTQIPNHRRRGRGSVPLKKGLKILVEMDEKLSLEDRHHVTRRRAK